MSITNLKDYKKAKIVTKDLDVISHILDLSIRSLSVYNKYVPAKDCIRTLKEQKEIVDLHNKKYKKILEKKNEKVEDDSK